MTEAIRELQARLVGGLEIGVLLHYTAELSRTTRLALHQYERLHGLTAAWAQDQGTPHGDDDLPRELDLFAVIEGFLTAYARTSLLLFPSKRKGFSQKRGAALREFLSIPYDHPIGDRTLRNAWMHYDKELDAIIQQSDRGRWSFIVLPNSSSASDAFRGEFLRLVDPITEEVSFLGSRYMIPELVGHVDSVRRTIDPALATIAAEVDA